MAVRLPQILFRKLNNTNSYKNIPAFKIGICSHANLRNYSGWGATKLGQESSEAEQKKKKTTIIPKITLLQGNDITITTLEEAQKLSKRRDLKLVKIVDLDTKTQRPIYKLMTASEYHEEDIKHREEKKKNKEVTIKGEKLIFLNYNIANHDLEVNIKKLIKWIGKSFEVRVVINADASKMNKAVSNIHISNFFKNLSPLTI